MSLKGIPFWSRVISLSISSRVSNFPFILLLLLLLLLERLGAPQPLQQSSSRVCVLILLLLCRRACWVLMSVRSVARLEAGFVSIHVNIYKYI